jgi:DNA topoisomerase-3
METAGRQLDEEELQRAMRSCGLGTPATRASILQTLLRRKYLERQAKDLRSTEQGRALIDAVPIDGLKSAELTGRWEGRLSAVAEAGAPRPGFMHDVTRYVEEVVEAIRQAPAPEVTVSAPEGDGMGACPACGKPVRQRGKVYACDSGRSCPFVVFGTMSKRKISARMVKQLLAEGRSAAVKGFRSKKGREFRAGLVWNPDEGRVGFWFPEDREQAPPPAREGQRCPTCGKGSLIRGRRQLGCSRWREGCGFRAPLPG